MIAWRGASGTGRRATVRRAHTVARPADRVSVMVVSGRPDAEKRVSGDESMPELEKTNLDYCFPTPVMCHVWDDSDDLNQELRRVILAHEREQAGRSRSNVDGWHSQTGMLEWCGDAGKTVIERAGRMANHASNLLLVAFGRQPAQFTWTFQAWANVNRASHFNKTHTHPGATWSGTYYVDPGNSPAN